MSVGLALPRDLAFRPEPAVAQRQRQRRRASPSRPRPSPPASPAEGRPASRPHVVLPAHRRGASRWSWRHPEPRTSPATSWPGSATGRPTASYALVKAVAPPGWSGDAPSDCGACNIVIATVASLAGGLLAGVDWRLALPRRPGDVRAQRAPHAPPAAAGTARALGAGGRVPGPPPHRPRAWCSCVTGLLALAADSGRAPAAWAPRRPSVVTLATWVVVERRRRTPAFPVRLFGSRPFVAAVFVGILVNGAYAAPVISLSDDPQYEKQGSVLTRHSSASSRSTSSARPPCSSPGGSSAPAVRLAP